MRGSRPFYDQHLVCMSSRACAAPFGTIIHEQTTLWEYSDTQHRTSTGAQLLRVIAPLPDSARTISLARRTRGRRAQPLRQHAARAHAAFRNRLSAGACAPVFGKHAQCT